MRKGGSWIGCKAYLSLNLKLEFSEAQWLKAHGKESEAPPWISHFLDFSSCASFVKLSEPVSPQYNQLFPSISQLYQKVPEN